MDIIKVSGTSRTSAVAGAIAGVFRENKRAEIQAIGAGAVNQAVKACVLAKGYLAEDGYDVAFTPEFTDVEIDGNVRTAIKLTVEAKPGGMPPRKIEAEEVPNYGTNEDEDEMEEEREPDESRDPFG
jgi:stage V sporulation protein S